MKFSLIMATYGETKVPFIKKFIEGLKNQTYKDFELIIVDQNEGNIVKDLIKDIKSDFITCIKCSPGLSHARNKGMRYAKGQILAFPDDDCLYPENMLKDVHNFLKTQISVNILAIDTKDINTLEKLPYTKKVSGEFRVSKNKIFKTITSISIFCKNCDGLYFDEKLGLGSKYPSCEEFDFVTKALKNGKTCFFSDKICVLHPNHKEFNTKTLIKKIKIHALGHGAYFRKHITYIYPMALYYMLISPIGGILYSLLKLDKRNIQVYYYFLIIRLKGFFLFRN